MSDGLTDYLRDHNKRVMEQFRDEICARPIVPRRMTLYDRMMWAEDLGLPIPSTPPYFWLGAQAEATNG